MFHLGTRVAVSISVEQTSPLPFRGLPTLPSSLVPTTQEPRVLLGTLPRWENPLKGRNGCL